ncbi:MAG: nitroreductase family protein [Dehalococcoidales bacterium]|nr:nitroreductase family protein [Dehalococcoidales bacterium]
MDVFDAIYRRRAIRDFIPGKKIPEKDVQLILDSARYALPTPEGNLPWKLITVRDQESKELIACCAKEVAQTMFGASFETFGPGHLWYLPRSLQLRVAEHTTTGELWEYPRDADLVVLPVLSTGGWTDSVVPFTDDVEIISQYLGFCSQNMWLVATSLGLGAGFNAMPFMDIRRREMEQELFGIPYSWQVLGGFAFGYSKAPRYSGPARPPLEGCTHLEYWGNPYLRGAFSKSRYDSFEFPKMDLLDAIRNLNVVDTFEPGEVEWWKVERILDAAMWGPVPENFKQWRFIVIKDQASKNFIQTMLDEKKHTPWSFNYPELQFSRAYDIPEKQRLEKVEERLERGYGNWVKSADTLIIVFSSFTNWRDQPYPTLGANPNPNRNVSVGCCTQNMFLAATAMGVGFNYEVMTVADRRNRQMIIDEFGAPGVSWSPQGIMALGKPGKKLESRRIPPLETLLYDETWGNPVSRK